MSANIWNNFQMFASCYKRLHALCCCKNQSEFNWRSWLSPNALNLKELAIPTRIDLLSSSLCLFSSYVMGRCIALVFAYFEGSCDACTLSVVSRTSQFFFLFVCQGWKRCSKGHWPCTDVWVHSITFWWCCGFRPSAVLPLMHPPWLST